MVVASGIVAGCIMLYGDLFRDNETTSLTRPGPSLKTGEATSTHQSLPSSNPIHSIQTKPLQKNTDQNENDFQLEEPRQKFQESILNLSKVIRQRNDNPNLLNEQYLLSESQEKFLSQLPPDLKEAYENVFQTSAALQKEILIQDGKSPDYFNSEKEAAPESWIVERAQELDSIELSSEIESFVQDVASSYEVLDEDVLELGRQCQGEQDCIEKSIKIWIDANHLLTEKQFQLAENFYKNNGRNE